MVTPAPADDCALRMNRYRQSVPATSQRKRQGSTARRGLRACSACVRRRRSPPPRRGTKLGGNRGVKPTVKMRIQSAAARQQRASARAADITPPLAELQGGRHYVIETDRSRQARARGPGSSRGGYASNNTPLCGSYKTNKPWLPRFNRATAMREAQQHG